MCIRDRCEDTWHKDYKNAPTDGSAWIKGGSEDFDNRVIRGSFFGFYNDAFRPAFRRPASPDTRYVGQGFRLVHDPR